jgi:hypothetical protein
MSKRLYSHKRVRYWYAYDLEDICAIFSDIGLHPQTVRKWIKNGLKTIDKGKPTLIYGWDLITHLKQHNQTNKCKTAFHNFYCMACQDGRPVFQNQVHIKQKFQFLQVQGSCRDCKSRMFKNYKLINFPLLKKQFKLVGVSELYDGTGSTDKTQIQVAQQTAQNESTQGELF